jgi:hypothetical protein
MFQKFKKLLGNFPRNGSLGNSNGLNQRAAKAMPDHVFWYIVDRARNETREHTYAALWELLSKVETEDVVSFAISLIEKKKVLATAQKWAANKLVNGSVDTSTFSGFLNWTVSLGARTFQQVNENVDDLANHLTPEYFGRVHFDDYSKVPAEVWREKTGRDPWEDNFAHFPPVRDFKIFAVSHIPNPSEAEFLSLEFPQLWEMFGSQAFPGHKSKRKADRTEPSPSNILH